MTFRLQVLYFGCLVAAIILHEISHGVVALWFGDDTAKRAGRLTLNPIPHIDLFGSIILPAMLVIAGVGAFGWAKPVPVNPAKLRKPREHMLFVGLAGPGTNFLLMTIAALAARMFYEPVVTPAGSIFFSDQPFGLQLLVAFALVNLLLGLFNLLPVPPLDGSSLIERVLPARWLPGWYRFRPYGFLVLFLLVFMTNVFGTILRPFQDALIRFIF